MGPDETQQSLDAVNIEALRRRVDQLERDVDLLRRTAAAAPSQPLPIASPIQPVPEPLVLVTREEVAPPPLPPPARAPSAPPPPKASLENRLGSQVFSRIGIVAILIGAAWGLKLAIDNHLIGPTGRILIGLIAGSGIILWSERFRRQGIKAFSYSLKAVGGGVLYLSLWAAFQLYHLLPAPVVLIAMLLVTAWNAYMAWSQDAELLAGYALIGAFATPLLLSTGGNHEVFLFTYLLAIDLATAALIRIKPWPRLLLGTFPATVAFFIGWYAEFFQADELGITAIFLILFGVVFASVTLGRRIKSEPASVPAPRHPLAAFLTSIFLPLANAAFISLGLYSILQDSHHHATLPWLMVILAAAYLGLMRLPQSRAASAIHLSLAIVFLTIAVPLKASGHWITVSWLVEGVALFWVSTRLALAGPQSTSMPDPEFTSLRDDTVVRWLSLAALSLGFVALLAKPFWFSSFAYSAFFNHNLATAIIGIAAFATVGWLAYRAHEDKLRPQLHLVTLAMLAIGVIAVLLSVRELIAANIDRTLRPAFRNAEFLTALVGLAVLGGLTYAALHIARARKERQPWLQLAGAATITLNLVAILSCVREITSLWSYSADNPTADLKQALAVSAFLMLYSAMLLAVGFWKRTAFIRWQGLILMVFTIAKTFLYDMSSLSQGYRVVSFLGLGVLLMAVSFAYQKDWLSLREPAVTAPPPPPATSVEEGQ